MKLKIIFLFTAERKYLLLISSYIPRHILTLGDEKLKCTHIQTQSEYIRYKNVNVYCIKKMYDRKGNDELFRIHLRRMIIRIFSRERKGKFASVTLQFGHP